MPSPVWPLPICLDSWAWHSRFLCNIVLYSIRLYFHYQSHPQLGGVFTLAPSLLSFWTYFSTLLQCHIGHLPTWGVHLSVSYLFAFSSCSWGSQGKNTEMVCHSTGDPAKDYEPLGIWLWRPVWFDNRTSTGLRKQVLGGHKQDLVSPGAGRKEQSPQETEPDLPVSVQVSPMEVGQQWPAANLLIGI